MVKIKMLMTKKTLIYLNFDSNLVIENEEMRP